MITDIQTVEERQRKIDAVQSAEWTPERIALLKRTVAKDATDDELRLFIAVCGRVKLDPFAHQLYFIKRGDVGTIQVGIDGYRVIAERTGDYDGQDPPLWSDDKGNWHDVWIADEHPAACQVRVYRKKILRPFVGIVRWNAYVQTRKGSGDPVSMWERMGAEMLAKCAEAQALRKAFPNDLAGVYTTEEDSAPLPQRDRRGSFGITREIETVTNEALEEAIVTVDGPTATPESALVEKLTLSIFYAACAKAEKQFGRRFIKNPTGTKQVWFVDQEAIQRSLSEGEQMGAVLIQENGEQAINPARLERLNSSVTLMLDEAKARTK